MRKRGPTRLADDLRGVEPWSYLRDILYLLPDWPAHRVLELAPLELEADRSQRRDAAAAERQRVPGHYAARRAPGAARLADSGVAQVEGYQPTEGYVLAPLDVALWQSRTLEAPTGAGRVEAIWVADHAGEPARSLEHAQALHGRGLAGDRHVAGTGTFPSGLPGSALTLIEAEVCESFTPALAANEHRRNIVTRGIELPRLVGCEFLLGDVRCRGVRLCEPCTVIDGYAGRPILRKLVHAGGLRADILQDGVIRIGDSVRVASQADE